MDDDALEVGKGAVAINDQPFDLMEHRRVRRVQITAVNASGSDNAQRGAVAFHRADLYARGVRAQHGFRVEVEGILHRPRRVIFGDIQGGEVVKIVFDFRAVFNDETEAGEPVLDAAARQRHRMQAALKCLPSGEGHVHPLGCQFFRHLPRAESVNLFLQRLLEMGLRVVDDFAQLRTFLGARLGKLLHMRGKDAFFREIGVAQRLQRGQVKRVFQRMQPVLQGLFQRFPDRRLFTHVSVPVSLMPLAAADKKRLRVQPFFAWVPAYRAAFAFSASTAKTCLL